MTESRGPDWTDPLAGRLGEWYAATPAAPAGGPARLHHQLARQRRRGPAVLWRSVAASILLLAGIATGMRVRSPGVTGSSHTFIIDAPSATQVSVVGDFNAWDRSAAPMRLDRASGQWRLALPLSPGSHAYAYVVDGKEWIVDPIAPQVVDRDLGTTNLLLAEAPR